MADSNVAITAGTGTSIDTRTANNGDHRQVMAIGNDGDYVANVLPWGGLETFTGFRTLYFDSWSTSPIDTTDKWTVSGTAPTISAGNMTMSATVSTYHAIRTKDLVRPSAGYTLIRNGITVESTAATGAGRFWGLGTTATTPAAAVLAQDGIGFEIDQATGGLLAVTYAAGARTTVQTLTAGGTVSVSQQGTATTMTVPSFRDALPHRYGLYFRATDAFWYIDSTPVAYASFPNVQIAELPALIVRYNAASFTGTPVFVNAQHLTADTAPTAQILMDPVVGTRQARVTPGGALVTDSNPARTTGTAAGNIFRTRVAPSAITGSTALQAAPGTGLSIYLTDVSVSNSGSTLNLVSFLDGATAIYDIVAAPTGGGGSMNFQTPIKLTANTALNYTTSAASQTYVTVTGYIAA